MDSFRNYGRNNCGSGQNMNRNMNCNMNQRPNSKCNMNQNMTVNMRKKDYDCFDEFLNLNAMPLAMAYVPMQQWEDLYNQKTAICEGTAFPCLNKIFCGVRGR